MDAKSSEEGGEVPKIEKSCSENLNGVSKLTAPGSISSKNMILLASEVGLKNIGVHHDKHLFYLDVPIDKHSSEAWSRNVEQPQNNSSTPRELWEIDPSKLEIRYLVAQGTYGTVYRGTYNTQDVAGILLNFAQTIAR